ncbi:unnamed protein product [Diatraea saccharalis]|uniref:Uncharacterized protein n=1 Tax=Diatraea saccharalis TaxID=40085 RepID=A0A9N9N3F6_9NEOP|nr:unnamed protein product [Diatraea saccharalis]
MKCARLHLQERGKTTAKQIFPREKPRRYCQRRFHCNPLTNIEESDKECSGTPSQDQENLYLTVQNLKFLGNVQDLKKTRTNFKYKSLNRDRSHRMFVKQVVEEDFNYEEDRSTPLVNYFDDYVKYILSTDRSRASSSKSSIHEQNHNFTEKSAQVDTKTKVDGAECLIKKSEMKIPDIKRGEGDIQNLKYNETDKNVIEDAKVAYYSTGKRKSLTISRVPSPETVQIIRVDVVCNYSTSSNISNSEEKKQQPADITKLSDRDIAKLNFKGSHFSDKYLLTNTIKGVDENLSCGSKVTLLCKTFKLSNRNKIAGKKYKKIINDGTLIHKIV